MNADNSQTFRGRLAELSPFEIEVAETRKTAACKSIAVRRKVSADDVAAEELYGCVDWYRYPDQPERPMPI